MDRERRGVEDPDEALIIPGVIGQR